MVLPDAQEMPSCSYAPDAVINEATSFVSKHISAKDQEPDITEIESTQFETLPPVNQGLAVSHSELQEKTAAPASKESLKAKSCHPKRKLKPKLRKRRSCYSLATTQLRLS